MKKNPKRPCLSITAISAATHNALEGTMKNLIAVIAVLALVVSCGFSGSTNSHGNAATIGLTSAASAFKVTSMKHEKTLKDVGPVDSVVVGATNVATLTDIEAGLYVANLQPVDPAFEAINGLPVLVDFGQNNPLAIEFRKKVTPVVAPDTDLTSLIAAANNPAGTELSDALGKLGTATCNGLVAAIGECSAKKQSAIGAWNTLSLALTQARADNPKRAEAQTALDSLKRKIEDAERAIVAAEDRLRACSAPDAGPVDSGTPDAGSVDSGTPDAGPADSGTPDAGPADSGTPDAGVSCPFGIAEGALYTGSLGIRVDSLAVDITPPKFMVYQCRSGNLVQVVASCSHPLLPDVAAVNNLCTTITPGSVAGCMWVTVSYPGATAGTRFRVYHWVNGATGVCSP